MCNVNTLQKSKIFKNKFLVFFKVFKILSMCSCPIIVKIRSIQRPLPSLILRSFSRSVSTLEQTILREAPKSPKLENLSKILGITPENAEAILIRNPKIKKMNDEKISKIIEILKENGVSTSWVTSQEYIDILGITPACIENYIKIFNETKFTKITPAMVAEANIHGCSINILKANGYIHERTNVIEGYLNLFKIPRKSKEEFWDILPQDPHIIPLKDLRKKVASFYLSIRANTKYENAFKSVVHEHRIHNRCFSWFKETVDILFDQYEFTPEKVLNNSYLLASNPDNLLKILQIKTLGGENILKMVRTRPKILMTPPNKLREIESIFHEHNIKTDTMNKEPLLYTLSTDNIRQKILELKDMSIFPRIRGHPRLSKVIYYQNKVKNRMDYLKSVNSPTQPSLHVLSADEERFKSFLNFGEVKTKGSDILYFLSDYFDMPVKEVRTKLQQHPHYQQISVSHVQDTLNYLGTLIDKSVIQKCLLICLYPQDKVQIQLENVLEKGDARFEDDFLLEMVLYYIEREVHFTGDGVYSQTIETEDPALQDQDS